MSYTKSQRNSLAAAAVGLLAVAGFVQSRLDPLTVDPAVRPKQLGKTAKFLGSAGAPFEYTLGALSGFRQVIAGMLWVRSDSFFHSGNYDAILPLIRLITWLDPNWLDPYATGAWHLTYNFTDTDQRSDRRYLPAGVALLKEGISNNSELYDMYKEQGWLHYDKMKDYEGAVTAYSEGMKHNPDITQVGHALAHSLEHAGFLDEAEKQWQFNVDAHKKILDDPKASQDLKGRSRQGFDNATQNLERLRFRRRWRKIEVEGKPPVEGDFHFKVTRTKSKVLEISGTFNLIGAKSFHEDKGTLFEGPVDGARVEVRLQNDGYKIPEVTEFSFEVPDDLTIMQDALSLRGGKKATKGGLYVYTPKPLGSVDMAADKVGVYNFSDEDKIANLGVPLDKALAGGAPISPFGQKQIVTTAYPPPFNAKKPFYEDSAVPALMAKLKADPAKIADMTKKGYCIATQDVLLPGKYKREIDMSKDPKMYNFKAQKYELLLTINPRQTPDFVKDRWGWNGEGLTDKRYLYEDKSGKIPVREVRARIELSREDILGEGKKVLAETKD